ncbi:thap domain-containing [Holotrichia oblita]|uniref:Thap domain-containing n=1 Tax=Holotrichia oblita TaxID=644536 RepID=A0ACB9SGA2_HOLOL|nr:thap domain-containing [Holotrichia oblita]
MSYEAEQARLQLLMDECMNFDIEFDDEEDTNEVDNLETFEEDTDTEEEVDDEDTVSETFEGPLFFGRDKKSKWRKHASTQKVKTRSKNIVTQLPGVRGPVKEVKEPLAIWKHFFDINMLNMIIDNTNKYIASVANNYSRDTYTRPTNLEIQAVIGLLLLSGGRGIVMYLRTYSDTCTMF